MHGRRMDARRRGRAADRGHGEGRGAARPGADAEGESAEECDDCGEPIPKKRREALPGVRTCVACQTERDKAVVHSTINRRGSKDSQLR